MTSYDDDDLYAPQRSAYPPDGGYRPEPPYGFDGRGRSGSSSPGHAGWDKPAARDDADGFDPFAGRGDGSRNGNGQVSANGSVNGEQNGHPNGHGYASASRGGGPSGPVSPYQRPADQPPSPPTPRAGGRASVGSASAQGAPIGSASVPLPPSGSASVPGAVGSASVPAPVSPPAAGGRPTTGRASVRPAEFETSAAGLSEGFDPFGAESPAESFSESPGDASAAGRASVPSPSGRASVGRAAVVAPADPDAPAVPGGPAGPGGPGGPAPGGPAGKKPVNKKQRRRRRIIASLAVLIMLTGIGVITGVYYTSSVTLPEDVPLHQSTTIYYSDGKTPLAKLGVQNRQILQDNQIPPVVKQAVTAAEDATFYTNEGVDFKGIVRAFVNNVTGGDTQGASTITQQYARAVAGLTYSASYTRKIKEIAIAMKMTKQMSKDEILDNYLNIVPFGRGAYGIQAAAEAYFGIPASSLKLNQAMVLAGLIKNPNGDVYDPTCGAGGKGPCQQAIDRFNYVKSQLPRVAPRPNYADAAAIAQVAYPTNASKDQNNEAANALASPQGFIVHHVMDELSHAKKADGSLYFPTTGPNSLKYGGYQIVTTIDKNAQAAAVKAASGKVKGTPMYGMKKGEGAAMVSVQPGTGAVVAYYGGYNGSNIDFAGIYSDPVYGDGGLTNESVTPGSSFKTVTLATALRQGISVNSYWYGPHSRQFDDRKKPVKNAGASEACPGAAHVCQLWKALAESLNTVYYAVGEDTKAGMTPAKVLDMAYDLGVKQIWAGAACGGKRLPLNGSNGNTIWPHCLGADLSFGAYGVTVQDMANVMATFANNGVRADEHFVNYVNQGYASDAKKVYQTAIHLTPVPGYTREMANDEQWAMQQVYKNGDESDNKLDDGRPAAVKTGTWEYDGKNAKANDNQSGFFNGYTAGDAKDGAIATSVWVGFTGAPMAVVDQRGHAISGATVPAAIWQSYMNAYLNHAPGGHAYPIQQFAGLQDTGDPSLGERSSPAPSPPSQPTQNPCDFPQVCQPSQPGRQPQPPPPTITPPSAPPSAPPSQKGGGGGGHGGGG
jgi:membrane peptidoglycan carboxypeptidase